MAQSGFGEAMTSFDEVADVRLSAVGLFLEGDLFCRGDLGLDPLSAMRVTGCLTGSMTFTVIQHIITHRNICYTKQLYDIRVSLHEVNTQSPNQRLPDTY
jgi:hypothetical protein